MSAIDSESLNSFEWLADFGTWLVIIGVAGEGVEIVLKVLQHKLTNEKFLAWCKNHEFSIEIWGALFWLMVVIGLAVEFRYGHKAKTITDRENARLTQNAAELNLKSEVFRLKANTLEREMMETKTNLANADPRSLPITSISGWIRIVVKPPSTNLAALLHLRPIWQNPPIALTNDGSLQTKSRSIFCVFGRTELAQNKSTDFQSGIPLSAEITSMRVFKGASPELDGNVRFDLYFDSTKEGIPVWNASNLSLNQFHSVQLWISNEWPPPQGIVGGQIDTWVNGLWKKSFQILAQTNRTFPYKVVTTNEIDPPYNF